MKTLTQTVAGDFSEGIPRSATDSDTRSRLGSVQSGIESQGCYFPKFFHTEEAQVEGIGYGCRLDAESGNQVITLEVRWTAPTRESEKEWLRRFPNGIFRKNHISSTKSPGKLSNRSDYSTATEKDMIQVKLSFVGKGRTERSSREIRMDKETRFREIEEMTPRGASIFVTPGFSVDLNKLEKVDNRMSSKWRIGDVASTESPFVHFVVVEND
ncbi:unnamed protein product [Caenorhabditis auriculariae]|uniref:Uncharacterized protein n=1 Tax=Caenorhabditis auriculariae TaxID=2777116 RepID=A0A8S1HRC3_9PELO|nr:unnamed protein product [Caenorhabditis auriculariae]